MASEMIKKALGFSLKVDDVSRHRKMLENHWSQSDLERRENCSKYLIKPVECGSFWSPKRKMASKMIKKALGFSLKVDDVLRLRKMLKKHWSQSVFERRKKLIKIPYKTCRIWIISEPKTQNGLQNDQKHYVFH